MVNMTMSKLLQDVVPSVLKLAYVILKILFPQFKHVMCFLFSVVNNVFMKFSNPWAVFFM